MNYNKFSIKINNIYKKHQKDLLCQLYAGNSITLNDLSSRISKYLKDKFHIEKSHKIIDETNIEIYNHLTSIDIESYKTIDSLLERIIKISKFDDFTDLFCEYQQYKLDNHIGYKITIRPWYEIYDDREDIEFYIDEHEIVGLNYYYDLVSIKDELGLYWRIKDTEYNHSSKKIIFKSIDGSKLVIDLSSTAPSNYEIAINIPKNIIMKSDIGIIKCEQFTMIHQIILKTDVKIYFVSREGSYKTGAYISNFDPNNENEFYEIDEKGVFFDTYNNYKIKSEKYISEELKNTLLERYYVDKRINSTFLRKGDEIKFVIPNHKK